MTPAFRILLILAAVLSFMFMISNIRRSRLRISDSIFWFLYREKYRITLFYDRISRSFKIESFFKSICICNFFLNAR